MYAKNLKLHRGVDNRIQFQFLNQEQKPIDVTGKEITIRIINSQGNQILLQKSLVSVLPLTGITEFRVTEEELRNISPQVCSYSLEIPVDSFNLPVFVDAQSDARGVIEILDSVLPRVTNSLIIALPDHPSGTYHSSMFQGSGKLVTVQLFLNSFSGKVKVQGSTLPDSNWYDISDEDYTDFSECVAYNIEGFHPYLRVEMTSTSGTVDKILAR